jgi:AraC family transcriptional regulator of arabinose operon
MHHSPENDPERALAGFYYSLMCGLEVSPARGRAAFEAWSRLAPPLSAAKPVTPVDPEAYLRAFVDNMTKSGFAQVCREWESRFDRYGTPFPETDVRRFVKDAIYLQYHSPHTHHDFFCICPTFKSDGIIDFQMTHPFADGFWTICLTESGVGIIETRLGEIDFLPAGSVALLPPGFNGRVGRANDAGQWRCIYLAFRPRPRSFDFLASAFFPKIPVVLNPAAPAELGLLRQNLNELSVIKCARGDINERLGFNLIENLLIRLHRLQTQQQESGFSRFLLKPADSRISAAVDFVLSHYEQPLTLQDIGDHANLSTSRLTALFRGHYGLGLIQWRDSIRLSKARDLIATTSLQISEIARQVGWEDQLYFSKRFKKKFGESPTDYRKHVQRAAHVRVVVSTGYR